MVGRGDFGNVKWCDHSGNTDADATDQSRHDERINIPRQPGPQGGDKIENTDAEQGPFASKTLGGPPPDQRSNDGAIERRSHGDPVDCGAEAPECLYLLFRARNNDSVESKEKSCECRGE